MNIAERHAEVSAAVTWLAPAGRSMTSTLILDPIRDRRGGQRELASSDQPP
jgi:hypothetical protein